MVGAFGLVRGLALATQILSPSGSDGGLTLSLDALSQAALAAGQSMLTFAFASVALEFAFRQGLVRLLRSRAEASGN